MKVTRRNFIKYVGFSTVFTIPLTFEEKFDGYLCRSCNTVNKGGMDYAFRAFSNTPLICRNCGRTLKDGSFKSPCKKECSLCCQIPFPNHRYLKGSNKPDFLLSMLRF